MEDAVEIVDDSTTCILPHEVLSQIFALLPLADRKSVRLTCRSWYDCCTCTNITKREKFVFRADASVEDAAEVMLRSSYSMMNLEFQGLPVSSITASTWKECGERIRELKFRRCHWDDGTIRSSILHCENLTSFVLSEKRFPDWSRVPYSTHLLSDLIKRGIRRPNLHTLSILIGSDEDEGVLRKIFLIHPCIRHLSVRTYNRSLRLDRCLNSDTRLESLLYKIFTDGKWMTTLVDKAEQGLRLKYLDLKLAYEKSMKDAIFNSFKSQRNLEVVRLSLVSAHSENIKDFFFHILESCPNLREFRLKTSKIMHVNYSEVPRFVASISKLNFLRLSCYINVSDHIPCLSNLPGNPVQLNLTSLKWTCHSCLDSGFWVAFLQRCSSLRHLHMGVVGDTALQSIFQYLPKLQTLILNNVDACTDFGFTGRDVDGNENGYSMKRLQQLKHLEFNGCKTYLTERSALEFQLPRLECLSLHVESYKQLPEEALNELASHLPELRVLTVYDYYDRNNIEKTIQFCKYLDNLNRLIFFGKLRCRACVGVSNANFRGGGNTDVWFADQEEGGTRFSAYLLHQALPSQEISKMDLAGFGRTGLYFGDLNTGDGGLEPIESIFSACHRLRYISSTYRNEVYFRDPFTGRALRKDRCIFKFPKNIFESKFV